MNTAQHVAQWLSAKGIADVFGVIGSGNAALWDAIARRGHSRLQCFHHEQAAAQAAVFYHRATGNHAAVLVTTGAGSSNVVTGILCAWMDSVPLLVIAGNEPTHFLKDPVRAKGAQGYNFVETLVGITKDATRLTPGDVSSVSKWLDCSYTIMLADRPGPVVLEIPGNVQTMEAAQ